MLCVFPPGNRPTPLVDNQYIIQNLGFVVGFLAKTNQFVGYGAPGAFKRVKKIQYLNFELVHYTEKGQKSLHYADDGNIIDYDC